jgi:large repetitive protein
MDRRCGLVVFTAVLLACVVISGCGGGGNSTTDTGVLTTTTTALAGGKVGTPYYVALTLTGGTAPYTWSQTSGGSMPPGVTFSQYGVFTGTPTQPGTFGPFVFKVTDANSDTSSTPSMSITIAGSPLSVTTTTLPSGIEGTPYSVTLSATGGSVPYTWSETSGGALPPGLAGITSTGVISGTPIAAGTYGPYIFTVTDEGNNTAASVGLTIDIAASGATACAPQGGESTLTSATPYAFLLKGSDSDSNPLDIAGSFTPDGAGGISAAAVDYNGFTNGHEQLSINLALSSYAFNGSGQGCLYLSFSGLASASVKGRVGPVAAVANSGNGARRTPKPATSTNIVNSVQFNFDLTGLSSGVYTTGQIFESDTAASGTSASGYVRAQSPTVFANAPSGLASDFVFGVDGWTAQSNPPAVLRTALAGAFANVSGTLPAGYGDLNTSGAASGEISAASGSLNLSTVDTVNGRGTGNLLFVSGLTNPLTFDFVYYIVNASDLILLSTDAPKSNVSSPLLAGRALVSGSSATPGTLSGYYVLASQGLGGTSTTPGNFVQIGTLNASSPNVLATANIYANNAGVYAASSYSNGTYAVDTSASGQRVSFSGFTSTPPVVYLTGGGADDNIAGFIVGTDTEASGGVLVYQSAAAPGYSDASVTGYWAASTAEDLDASNGAYLGAFNFDGAGAYSIIASQSSGTVANSPTQGSIAVNPDGSGSLDGGALPLVTNGQTLFAVPNTGDPLLFIFTVGTL